MPAVCRFGDLDLVHCSLPVRLGCSSNVRVNGIGISRQGDLNTSHQLPPYPPPVPCPFHSAGITLGSTTVRVNGLGCGRVGDSIFGCTFVATGSGNVFAG